MDIQEIIRLAFLKYRLNGRRSMNTFIFTQAKNNKLTDKQIEEMLQALENKIKTFEAEKKQKQDKEIQKEIEKTLFEKVV